MARRRGQDGEGGPVPGPKGSRNGPKAKGRRSFYAKALSEADRHLLEAAQEVQGLDEEIALLRVRLSQTLQEHPENLELLLKGMNLLVRAVATRYRLSPQAQEDLAQSIAGVLRGIGGVIWPEAFGSEPGA